ncbi:toll-like receptor 13 isoform X1 [Mercenaria mercenaria]|uniref:toll-like receptor 13 isoform X1 n=1 Tax=Mercenaria mercenaria TaxID=6596 RepID=UPI00234F175E|nr:toll-like receptor 13 isoform X1 [Mercenaria mercenaria]
MTSLTGIFIWIFFGGVCSEVSDRIMCPKKCECEGHVLRCNRMVLNEYIPDNITEVLLTTSNTSWNTEMSSTFTNWSNVIKLDITYEYTGGDMIYFHFANSSFRPFKQLQYLGLHGFGSSPASYMYKVQHARYFSGLENVKTLNLSGNSHLEIYQVIETLKEVNILPSLETIDLSELQLLLVPSKPIYGNEFSALVSVLRSRSIKTIILDNTHMEFPIAELRKLCQTLEKFSLRKTSLVSVYQFESVTCESLKVLDLSEAAIVPLEDFIRSRMLTSDTWFIEIFNTHFSFICGTETLYYNEVLPSKPRPLSFDNGVVFNATGITWRVKYMYFRRNFMENFNVSFKNMPLIPGSEFDVSFNNIHYIHPKSLDPGHYIRKINLAHNRLHEMERSNPLDFEIFLHTFTDLEDINLAYNQISKLPSGMFSKNTKLKEINVAGNRLKTLSIKTNLIPNLQYLYAVDNNLEICFLKEISQIYQRPFVEANLINGANLIINITGNELKCTCDDTSAIEWIRDSPFVRGGMCIYEDEKLDIKQNAFEKITDYCKKKKFQQSLIIGVYISITLFYLTAICIALAVRYKKKQNKIVELLRQLKTNDEHFLAFVSYCSEDTDFVMSHLVNQLNEEICIKTKVRGDHICTGDRYFRPGFPVITEIMTNMENSSVIIFVISLEFCNKPWCNIEIKEAQELQKPIILIFREEVDLQDMPKQVEKLFHQNTRCKFERDVDGAWKLQPSFHVLASSVIELAAVNHKTGTPKNFVV